MQATTIKIEGNLLKSLKKYAPKEESISSFVRRILEQDLQRKKMIQAGETYTLFLKGNPEEQVWLEEWEKANLSSPPQKNRKTKKYETR